MSGLDGRTGGRVFEPMLATACEAPPSGPEWVHEVKWDGMRVLADVRGGRLRLSTRGGTDATNRFPELTGLLGVVDDAVFDGEVVSMHAGMPSFAQLSQRIHVRDASAAVRLAGTAPVTYMVFDVLRLCGTDLTDQPWRHRRALLESLPWGGSARLVVPPTYPDGDVLLAATAEQGLEGVVSKRLEGRYHPGRRSPDWRKHAHRPSRSVVVGGWRPEAGSRSRLGALLVGEPHDGGLRFLGRVGSGLGAGAHDALMPQLRELARDVSPFDADLPAADVAGTRWVQPRLVVDVRSLGSAAPARAGRLRQPAYLGRRADLTPADLASPDLTQTDLTQTDLGGTDG